MLKLLNLVIIMSFVFGCAVKQVVPKHDLTKLDKKTEGVFSGQIKIVLDDDYYTDSCHLVFLTEKNKDLEVLVPIEKDGSFIAKAPKGRLNLDAIKCHTGGSVSKIEKYYFKEGEVYFQNHGGKFQTNIGNIDVKWNSGGFNPAVTILAAAVGWIAVAKSNAHITLKHSKGTFRKLASVEGKLKKSLLVIPYGLKPDKK